jgi:hypothetical protein
MLSQSPIFFFSVLLSINMVFLLYDTIKSLQQRKEVYKSYDI